MSTQKEIVTHPRKLLVGLIALILLIAPCSDSSKASDERTLDQAWNQGHLAGFVQGICTLETDGHISPQQTRAYLMVFRETERSYNDKDLKSLLRIWIGLKRCSLARTVNSGGDIFP